MIARHRTATVYHAAADLSELERVLMMIQRTREQGRERLILIVILVLGAWLRFQHLGEIEYNIDQAYPVWQAIQTLDHGHFPLAGQGTSVLFANPPLTGYFFVPVIGLLRQPLAAYLLTLTLNTLAIWLAYRALRGLIGTRPALVGAALFAANPWIIEDSRRTWVQSLAPFFACLIFWALVPVLTGSSRHPRRRLLVALIGLALFAHTYLLAYALLLPVGLLLLVFWRRIPKLPLGIGAVVFAILMALYGIGLARQWDDTKQRSEQFSSGHARLSSEALNHALGLVTGRDYADARGVTAPADDADLRDDLSDGLHVAWAAAIGIGVVLAGYGLLAKLYPPVSSPAGRDGVGAIHELPLRAVHRGVLQYAPTGEIALILLIWFLLPVAMMSYVSRVVHPFYLLLTVPAGHGLAALGIDPLLRRRRIGWVAAGLVIATVALNGVNTIRFAQNTAAHPGEDLPETLPLADALALGSRMRAAREPGMAILSPMEEWTSVTLVGHAIRVEKMDGFDQGTLIPAAGGLYLTIQRDPAAPVPPPLYADPAGSPLILGDGTRLELWRAHPRDLVIAHPADIPSDIDVNFAGWTLNGDLIPGQTVTLDTFWRIDALHPERGIWNFAPFAHLYDASGARRLVANGPVISALKWAAGDLLVERIVLAVPDGAAGPFAIHVGLFDSVRVREDGVSGINAIFRLPSGGETTYTAEIEIDTP
jgi:4-amino-4-deoxy-L-arabinose transferase-like glycosyltransferase